MAGTAENYLKNLARARKEFERTRGRKMTDADVKKWQEQIGRSQDLKKIAARRATASDKQGNPTKKSSSKSMSNKVWIYPANKPVAGKRKTSTKPKGPVATYPSKPKKK